MTASAQLPAIAPRPLRPADRIAILSPAGIIKPQLVFKTIQALNAQGWEAVTGKHTFGRYQTYASPADLRLADFTEALLDPSIRAILCSRGGYGCVQLIEQLNRLPLRDDPKWVIGFSDVSALHALMSHHGIISIHSPMCKHIANNAGSDMDTLTLFSMLNGRKPDLHLPAHPLNRPGEATGTLRGGNFAVINGLLSTPFNVIRPGTILFIEDIAEPVYKIERMLYTLRLNGTLPKLGALIVGQFTDYTPVPGCDTMQQMIARMVSDCDYPVAFNAPIGHVVHNTPLLYSSTVTLTVTPTTATLRYNL